MWSWFTKGHTDDNDGDSFAEGIGQSRVTANLEGLRVDAAYRIPDPEALSIIYRLLHEEGIFLGLSSGVNVAGALRYAREHGPGHTIVTILCDTGAKYLSKLSNPDWLAAQGLDPHAPVPGWD
jgi:cysteine synthase A